jgi:hypothetical protein
VHLSSLLNKKEYAGVFEVHGTVILYKKATVSSADPSFAITFIKGAVDFAMTSNGPAMEPRRRQYTTAICQAIMAVELRHLRQHLTDKSTFVSYHVELKLAIAVVVGNLRTLRDGMELKGLHGLFQQPCGFFPNALSVPLLRTNSGL